LNKIQSHLLHFYIFFRGYVGVSDPRGNYFWPLAKNIDLIQYFLYPIRWMLHLAGYHTIIYKTAIGIVHGPGVYIAFPCLGIGMSRPEIA